MKLKKSPLLAAMAVLPMVFGVFAVNPAAGAKEGFGSSRKSVRIERVVPPAVALGAASFAVRTVGADAPWSRRLEAELAKELTRRDSGLVANPAEPQVLIELTILRNQLSDRWESKPERERREIGLDSRGKSIFKAVEVAAQYQVIVHEVAVDFRILEAATGALLDSGSVEAPFEGRFRDGVKAPALATLETKAIGNVVDGIAGRLRPVREHIEVPLPEGRLASLAALARPGHWGRYRDAAAALAPSPDREDEAYRQYALALANEALAYAAPSGPESVELLQLAASQYQAAIAAHPGEKLFAMPSEAGDGTVAAAAPLDRVRTALASFERSEAARPPAVVAAPAVAAPAVAAPAVAAPASRAAGGAAMDNAAVIRMVREGKGGYAILQAIKAAPALAFDFSPEGLAELSAEKVDPKIIGYMRQYSGPE